MSHQRIVNLQPCCVLAKDLWTELYFGQPGGYKKEYTLMNAIMASVEMIHVLFARRNCYICGIRLPRTFYQYDYDHVACSRRCYKVLFDEREKRRRRLLFYDGVPIR